MRSCLRLFLFFVVFFIGSAVAQEPEKAPSESQSYTFNPLAVKRDPFEAPAFTEKSNLSDLERYDLNEMNLVAILTGMGRPQAMIVLPNAKTHIVQIGDRIGRHNGKVFKVSDSEIVVRENFKDYQNRSRTSLTSLVLAQ